MAEKKSIDSILGKAKTTSTSTFAESERKKGGRPKLLNEKERDVAVRLYNDRKNSIMEICQLLKISKPTLYNYLHQANNQ